jgi:hypothetical protein
MIINNHLDKIHGKSLQGTDPGLVNQIDYDVRMFVDLCSERETASEGIFGLLCTLE